MLRSIDLGKPVAGERRVRQLKFELAATAGTGTATFERGEFIGAYCTDPQQFLTTYTAASPFVIVGGDSGGGFTKLGVTFLNALQTVEFAALVVYDGKDDYTSLSRFLDLSPLSFTGSTLALPVPALNFFTFLQYQFLHHNNFFLNGDWVFLNALLGLKSPSASHPCPICTVHKNDFVSLPAPPPRNPFSTDFTLSRANPTLLLCPTTHIVPTPLHVFLGICNRIIGDLRIYPFLMGEERVAAARASVKSTYSYSAGAAAVHDLNGPELSLWLKKDMCMRIYDQAEGSAHSPPSFSVVILSRWMHSLYHFLLHKNQWDDSQISQFSDLVAEMQRDWQTVTDTPPFPKLHMLSHCLDFAKQHKFLGRFSEAPIESYHSKYNFCFAHTHRNQGKHKIPRLRRSMADQLLMLASRQTASSAKHPKTIDLTS